MKRHPSLIPLSREHHDTLILAQVIKKDAPEYLSMPTTLEGKKDSAVSHFNHHLKSHFKKEEEQLFQKIKGKHADVDELITQLTNEHRQIESLVNSIDKNESLEENLNQLGILLENHIRKEERQLFELIPKKFEDSFLDEIVL